MWVTWGNADRGIHQGKQGYRVLSPRPLRPGRTLTPLFVTSSRLVKPPLSRTARRATSLFQKPTTRLWGRSTNTSGAIW